MSEGIRHVKVTHHNDWGTGGDESNSTIPLGGALTGTIDPTTGQGNLTASGGYGFAAGGSVTVDIDVGQAINSFDNYFNSTDYGQLNNPTAQTVDEYDDCPYK